MSLTLELSPEAERALRQEASAAGVPPPVYAARLLYRSLNLPEGAPRQSPSLAELFAGWATQAGDQPLTADEARTEDTEWDEIAANIDRNRVRFPVPDAADND